MLFCTALDALFPSSCGGCGAAGSAFCAACRVISSRTEVRHVAGLRLVAVGAYAGTLRRAILAYKCGRRDVGEALAAWLAQRCGPFDTNAVFVPVPTTAARRAERGFDQSVDLARRLSVLRERPLLLALRHRTGDAQRGRSRTARLAARDRFACVAPRVLGGVRIVLVDDVVTTGATAADSAQTLRAHGAVVNDAVVLAAARR